MIHKTFPGSPVRHHNLKRSHPWGKWTWPWIISNLLPIWHRHGMYIYWGRLFPDVAENKVTANYPEHAVTFSASCLSLKRPVWIKGKWWIIQYNRDYDRKERESWQKKIGIVNLIDLARKGGYVHDWTLEPRSPICVLAKALLKNTNLREQTIRPGYYLIDPINCPPSEMEFAHALRVRFKLCLRK